MDETTKSAMESGRPVTIFNIKEVHQLNPNATHITNNYYGDQFVPKNNIRKETSADENATRNPKLIIDYVMRLHPEYIRKEWKDKYLPLWESILQLPVVANEIYTPGRQLNTLFNRKLVGNILRLMKVKNVFTPETKANLMAEILEGSKDSPMRIYLGEVPETKEIKKEIDKLFNP